MKRILLAIFLIAASMHGAVAQTVTRAAFTSQVNLMDTQIGTGDITSANATFNDIQLMMKQALHDNKQSIATATTDAAKAAFLATVQNQGVLFNQAWKLKNDLATNRAAIHAKLSSFEMTLD